VSKKKSTNKYTESQSICEKKKKQRLTEKRNHTWCELGHDSRSGVKEGGTGLLDLDSEGSVCRCGVCHATRGRVGKGCG
jgi:hypothetical protein